MSSDIGRDIFSGLQETRKFFEQISLLLRAVDSFLDETGWDTLFGNKCSYVSDSLDRHKNWMPKYVRRIFISKDLERENRQVVIYIAVLLDGAGWGGFIEPWITCGLFRLIEGKKVTDFRDWDWVTSHLDNKHDPDGEFRESDPYDLKLNEEYDWLAYEASMALPLMQIQSPEDLKSKVIDPLLQKIHETRHIV